MTPIRAEQHWQNNEQALMVTHRPMTTTLERGSNRMEQDSSQMELGSSRMESGSPMELGYSMDAFLDITLKEEGSEQQESLQVKTLTWLI